MVIDASAHDARIVQEANVVHSMVHGRKCMCIVYWQQLQSEKSFNMRTSFSWGRAEAIRLSCAARVVELYLWNYHSTAQHGMQHATRSSRQSLAGAVTH